MPSITREQIERMNSQAPDGWSFDWKYYVIHGEKTIRRMIPLDDSHVVEARICYSENIETRQNEFCSWRVPAGHYHVCLHVSNWTVDANGTGHSFGLGHFENLDHAQHTKRNYKDLCKIAANIVDETILNYSGQCKDKPLTCY